MTKVCGLLRQLAALSLILLLGLAPVVASAQVVVGPGVTAAVPQLRQVFTRSYVPSANYTGATQIQSRTGHWARDNVATSQLVFGNWWVKSGSGDTNNASSCTIRASVEFPVGTFTRVTFGGLTTGTIAAGTDIVSDPIAVAIPKNSKAYEWNLLTCSAGIIYTNFLTNEPNGDGGETGTALTDKTGGGSSINAGTNFYFPEAWVGLTTNPAVQLWGDSLEKGQLDTFDDITSDQGVVARSIGPYMGYTNMGTTGDTTAAAIASHAHRLALSQYFSHIVSNYGGPNDQSIAPATVIANLVTLGSYFPGKTRFLVTLAPKSTSTDSWATLANQTVSGSTFFPVMNKAIRAIPTNWDGYLDIAKSLESSPDSGLWAPPSANGGGALTSDGTHPVTIGNQRIRQSGEISPDRFFQTLH